MKNQLASRCQTAKFSKTQSLPYEQGIFYFEIIYLLLKIYNEIEWALTRFFQQILKSAKSFRLQKDYLLQSLDFNLSDAFSSIDIY